MPPLVSVIIPAYNAEAYLRQALESVCSQTYTHLEILLWDDGSDDGTRNIIQEYVRRDHRVRLVGEQRTGHPGIARNKLMKAAKGEYFAFLDCDDLWVRNKIELQLEAVSANQTWSLCYTGNCEFSGLELPPSLNSPPPVEECGSSFANELIAGPEGFKRLFLSQIGIATPSVLLHRTLVERIGYFDERPEMIIAEDVDFFCRAFFVAPLVFIPQVLVYIRKHGSNTTVTTPSWPARLAFMELMEERQCAPRGLLKKGWSVAWLVKGEYSLLHAVSGWRKALLLAWYYDPFNIKRLPALLSALMPKFIAASFYRMSKRLG